MKKYVTNSLDEATYLSIRGNIPEIKVIGDRCAKFSFVKSRHLEENLKSFWSKASTVEIHLWLSTRQNIKHITISQAKIDDSANLGLASGSSYWFIQNKNVLHALYGKAHIHRQRKQVNNFYDTKELAEEALKHATE